VFFFECPDYSDFSATAMAIILQQQWSEFIQEDKLDEVISKYNIAMRKTDE